MKWVVACEGVFWYPNNTEYATVRVHGIWDSREAAQEWILRGDHKSVCTGTNVEETSLIIHLESDYIG